MCASTCTDGGLSSATTPTSAMAVAGPTADPHQRAYPARKGRRPRVLVETADRALLISDYRFLRDAGFDVALCGGPGHDTSRCPVLRGEECDLVTRSDVVLHALDPNLQIAGAIKAAHPELPVVVQRPRRREEASVSVPDGCIPLDMPCSLDAQLVAIRRAANR